MWNIIFWGFAVIGMATVVYGVVNLIGTLLGSVGSSGSSGNLSSSKNYLRDMCIKKGCNYGYDF